MRGTRAKAIRRFCKYTLAKHPGMIEPELVRNFYLFAKRMWRQDKWKRLKRELALLSSEE